MNPRKKHAANEHDKSPALAPGKPGVRGSKNAQDTPDSAGVPSSWWRSDWLLGFILVALTITAYQPAWHGGMIWDDNAHVTPPKLRSLHGLASIWTQLGATQQYYPLIHTVFWVEHKLWGDSTAGYHWVNILLHAFSALLLVKILRQLNIPGAWLAAALFALHPVEVESVAWISELKNTLSGVFYFSAALAYLGFDRNRSRGNYVISFGLFLLGLMSKTVIASLPAALLVIFWWQRGKLSWKQDVLPLIPFFGAGIGAGLLTAWVERKFIGAEGTEFHFSIIERCLIAGRALWFYVGKLVWPVDLAFVYPRWNVNSNSWWQYLFPAAALLLLGIFIWRRWRGPLAGLLFFAGTLFPALGFFNVYPFRYSFVADHFQYLASLGLLTLVAAGLTTLRATAWKRTPFVEPMLCAALLLVLATLTWKQCGMYANAETLWQTTLRLNPDSWLAHLGQGHTFLGKGQVDEAILENQKAVAIRPDLAQPHYALAFTLLQKGRLDEAIAEFRTTIKLHPDDDLAHYNLANALRQKGQMDEAILEFQKAAAIRPDFAEAQNNLGRCLLQQGRADEAVAHLRKAQEIQPDYAEAHYNLGSALLQKGQVDEAGLQFQKLLAIQPESVVAQQSLAGIAWRLATSPNPELRNGAKALELALQSIRHSGNNNPMMTATLAAAYAEAGHFDQAVAAARRALQMAASQNNAAMAAAIQTQLDCYQAGSPFRDTGKSP
jgi:protein O-mannosyl-transferase